jgi:uncharacterized protein YfcZ (UPF0381/DUF406 family)
MVTLQAWLRTIAAQLGDDEPGRPFQRYTLTDMIAAYNAAMCLVARYRADLFTELRVIRLQAGKYQDARGCCSNVTAILDQTDSEGNVLKELGQSRHSKTVATKHWKKPSCVSSDDADAYFIDSVQLDTTLDGRFTVYPPVPCGVSAYVVVKCVQQLCALTVASANAELNGDCVHNVAAWHYVLATMLTGDRFDNGGSGNAQYHYRLFFDILGIVQKQDAVAESEETA